MLILRIVGLFVIILSLAGPLTHFHVQGNYVIHADQTHEFRGPVLRKKPKYEAVQRLASQVPKRSVSEHDFLLGRGGVLLVGARRKNDYYRGGREGDSEHAEGSTVAPTQGTETHVEKVGGTTQRHPRGNSTEVEELSVQVKEELLVQEGPEPHDEKDGESTSAAESPQGPEKLQRWKKIEGEMYMYCVSMNLKNCPGEQKYWRKSEGVIEKPPSLARWELSIPIATLYCSASEKNNCNKAVNGEWKTVESKMTRWEKKQPRKWSATYYCEGVHLEDCPKPLEGWVLHSVNVKFPPRGVRWMDSMGGTSIYCKAEEEDHCAPLVDGKWKPVVQINEPRRWRRTGSVTFFCDAFKVESCPAELNEWNEFDEDISEPPVHAVWSLKIDDKTKLYCSSLVKKECETKKSGEWELVNPDNPPQRWERKVGHVRVFCDSLRADYCIPKPGGWNEVCEGLSQPPKDVVWHLPVNYHTELYCSSLKKKKCELVRSGQWELLNPDNKIKRWERQEGHVTYFCDGLVVGSCPPEPDKWGGMVGGIIEIPENVVWYLEIDDKTDLFCSALKKKECGSIERGDWKLVNPEGKPRRWKKKGNQVTYFCDTLKLNDCPPQSGKWDLVVEDVDEHPKDAVWQLLEPRTELYCSATNKKKCELLKSGKWKLISSGDGPRRWKRKENEVTFFCDTLKVDLCPPEPNRWEVVGGITEPPKNVIWHLLVNDSTELYCSALNKKKCDSMKRGQWELLNTKNIPHRWKSEEENTNFFCDALKVNACPSASWKAVGKDLSQPPKNVVWYLLTNDNAQLYCSSLKKNECESLKSGDWKLVNPEDKPRRWQRKKDRVTFFCDSLKVDDCPPESEKWSDVVEDIGKLPKNVVWQLRIKDSTVLYCSALRDRLCETVKTGEWKLVDPSNYPQRWRREERHAQFFCDALKVDDCPPESDKWDFDDEDIVAFPKNVVWHLSEDKTELFCSALEKKKCASVKNGEWKPVNPDVKPRRWKKGYNGIEFFCDAFEVGNCPLKSNSWYEVDGGSFEPPKNAIWYLLMNDNTELYCSGMSKKKCGEMKKGKWELVNPENRPRRWKSKASHVKIFCDALKVDGCPPGTAAWGLYADDIANPPKNVVWHLQIDEKTELYCSTLNKKKCESVKSGQWELLQTKNKPRRWRRNEGHLTFFCDALKVGDCPTKGHSPSSSHIWDQVDEGPSFETPKNAIWHLLIDDRTELFCSALKMKECKAVKRGQWKLVSDKVNPQRWTKEEGPVRFFCDALKVEDCPQKPDWWGIAHEDIAESPNDVVWHTQIDDSTELYCSALKIKNCKSVKDGSWELVNPHHQPKRWKMMEGHIAFFCDALKVNDCPAEPEKWDVLLENENIDEPPKNSVWHLLIDDKTELYCSALKDQKCQWLRYGEWQLVNPDEKPLRFERIMNHVSFYCDTLNVADCPLETDMWDEVEEDFNEPPKNAVWRTAIKGDGELFCSALKLEACTVVKSGRWALVNPNNKPHRWKKMEGSVTFFCDAMTAKVCSPEEHTRMFPTSNWEIINCNVRLRRVHRRNAKQCGLVPENVIWHLRLGYNGDLYCSALRRKKCESMRRGRWELLNTPRLWKKKHGLVTVYCFALRLDDCPSSNSIWFGTGGKASRPEDAKWFLPIGEVTLLYCNAKRRSRCRKIVDSVWKRVKNLLYEGYGVQRWKTQEGSIVMYCEGITVQKCPGTPRSWVEDGGNLSQPPPSASWILKLNSGIKLYCAARSKKLCSAFLEGDWERRLWVLHRGPLTFYCETIFLNDCPPDQWTLLNKPFSKVSADFKYFVKLKPGTRIYCVANSVRECSTFRRDIRFKKYLRRRHLRQPMLRHGEFYSRGRVGRYETFVNGILVYCDAPRITQCPKIPPKYNAHWFPRRNRVLMKPDGVSWQLQVKRRSRNRNTKRGKPSALLYCRSKNVQDCNSFVNDEWKNTLI